jgi:hypothetical protein
MVYGTPEDEWKRRHSASRMKNQRCRCHSGTTRVDERSYLPRDSGHGDGDPGRQSMVDGGGNQVCTYIGIST